MDVLSEVLRAVRLDGAVFFDIEATAPWAVASPKSDDVRARVMPTSEHVIPFHFMMEGEAWLQTDLSGSERIHLQQGDVILMPRGDAHYLGSDPAQRVEPDMDHYRRPTDQELPFRISEVGSSDGRKARIVCGYFGCDAGPFNPLVEALPRLMHVKSHPSHDCVAAIFITAALNEKKSGRPGGEAILARLSELMLVQAIRVHIDGLPPGSEGWLSGLRDPLVGKVLQLIHGEPGRDWSIAALARCAGTSRSVLAERFMRLVHISPMAYLARWRMQLAAHALGTPGATISSIAADMGYQSEAAFNRAFKKIVGQPPGSWRRHRQDAA
jgi:AraC-like DNA-binding protein